MKMTEKKIQELADELLEYLVEHELFDACRIYFNGKCYQDGDIGSKNYVVSEIRTISAKKRFDDIEPETYAVYTLEGINPKDFFEFTGDILCVSTEGTLYDVINDYDGFFVSYWDNIEDIFDKYGLYADFGNAWNFALYEK